ncbi:hypothetical protein PENSPDRAFT_179950 [Peniophora sp. CONT]|nr:hypothetical protein PENSPDRAFT_179950 [Peniophora sp. CONT]
MSSIVAEIKPSEHTAQDAAVYPVYCHRGPRRAPSPRAEPEEKSTAMRVHLGAVDRTMLTHEGPPLVMARVRTTLTMLGIVVQDVSEFKVVSGRRWGQMALIW